ncbi:hypothetical protein AN643_01240 [Candidatus Epulonipiscioides saccharophilum]|nr:hypothetical protein AN643_01240 [Epulopiscium sp. SCG-B10WGA-EpuloB]
MTNNKYYKKVIQILDQRRLNNIKEQKERKQEIYKVIPKIEKIDEKLNEKGITFIKYMLDDTKEPIDVTSKKFQNLHEKLTNDKKKLLESNGYPPNYLDLQFVCNECQDEGFKNDKPCKCFEEEMSKLLGPTMQALQINKNETFENFNFDFYTNNTKKQKKDDRENTTKIKSPRELIEETFYKVKKFVKEFPKYENIIFVGNSGLGKTFLCNCIANELIKKRHIVFYVSAINLFKIFDNTRFKTYKDISQTHKELLDSIFESELLIIDDLGSEFITDFTKTDLFHIINSRNLACKSTIISTNMDPSLWKVRYSSRVYSRLFGNSTIYSFTGEDIRVQKKFDEMEKNLKLNAMNKQ